MITDQDTNFVYVSSLLSSEEKYQPFWLRLKDVLDKAGINYGLLEGTKDIWCRDYMPVQVSDNQLVQFQYWPSYLDNDRYRHTRTDAADILFDVPFSKVTSSLKVDGGNIVKEKHKVIVTERIFKENSHLSKEEVLATLQEALQVEKLFIIPNQPYDFTGHADGMVRFLDERRLLVNDFKYESPSWQRRLNLALQKTGLEIIPFPYVTLDERNKEGDYTARGCYINFAQIGNVILLPFFDLPEDELALRETQRLFPECKIFPVLANEIARQSGVLNCASWNIMI